MMELMPLYLDGSTFDFGAVCALNTIQLRWRALSAYKVNNVLLEKEQQLCEGSSFEEKTC